MEALMNSTKIPLGTIGIEGHRIAKPTVQKVAMT